MVRAAAILGLLTLLAFSLSALFAVSAKALASLIASVVGVGLAGVAAYAFKHPLEDEREEAPARREEFEGLS